MGSGVREGLGGAGGPRRWRGEGDVRGARGVREGRGGAKVGAVDCLGLIR